MRDNCGNRPGHSAHCRCASCGAEHEGTPLLAMENVWFGRDRRMVLSDINITVDYGDFVAITGPNGGGKTTLLRLILGLLKPQRGSIRFYDKQGAALRKPVFGYLPQKNTVDSMFPITVREVVASGLLTAGSLTEQQRAERVEQALETVAMAEMAARPIGRLSGGQLQRSMLARAIVMRPEVLVLDEPLSYIDLKFEHKLYDILAEQAQHSTVLMVNHQMSPIGALANRHVIVDHTLEECTARVHYQPEA